MQFLFSQKAENTSKSVGVLRLLFLTWLQCPSRPLLLLLILQKGALKRAGNTFACHQVVVAVRLHKSEQTRACLRSHLEHLFERQHYKLRAPDVGQRVAAAVGRAGGQQTPPRRCPVPGEAALRAVAFRGKVPALTPLLCRAL